MMSDKKLSETYDKTTKIFFDYINRISNELDSKGITIDADFTLEEMNQLSENRKAIEELEENLNGLEINT